MTKLKNLLAYVMVLGILNLGMPNLSQARIIGTLEAIEATQHAQDLTSINRALARVEVQKQLGALGVQPDDVQARIAVMTDREVNLLASKINSAPAGGELFALVGIVFVVLMILEAVGVIDIFKKFP